ncbi:radical SAM protein [Candidatus Woesearchaeota archaeon CG_4_10_14_0_2_um_filter_33_10]|nr:MAG: radical SAM protein [Candidatus Woesearchaeota archaeon CG10_big_fil_rev_8_21_14_0_10_33_12]PIU72113.1 MAG: radical SAM protein [Candidatus Woesearchaeota archaeon CG06_land_8_20_14_3_00_33_13]PIZ52819.1 MAG: radical SAM protein [Candidatus Woesearchaeota archaeon CG_4_10_14_0_2_um_filter_33_10]
MKIYEIKAKSILHKTKIPGADFAINHYSGCQHACIYCYARFICRWRRKNERWGDFVDVKINAPELVAEESKNKKGTIILCTTADPYQPIEKKYKLTKKVLQNLNKNMKLSILTKSDLITRDIDLFKRFKNCELGLTITTLDENIKKIFEPFSPSSNARLEALKKLKKEGFYTYAFIGPILPYLTNLEKIFKEVSPFVDLFMFEDLNLSLCKKEIFKVIRKKFPELEEKYKNLSKAFWFDKEKEIKNLGKRFDKPVKIYFKHTGSLTF